MSLLKVAQIQKLAAGSEITIGSALVASSSVTVNGALAFGGSATINLTNISAGELTIPPDIISGNAIDGGVISSFTSTGISDTCDTNQLTVDEDLTTVSSTNGVAGNNLARCWATAEFTLTYDSDGVPVVSGITVGGPGDLSIFNAAATITTKSTTDDSVTVTYGDGHPTMDGTKSCAIIQFRSQGSSEVDWHGYLPHYCTYTDGALQITFQDGTLGGSGDGTYDSTVLSVEASIVVFALNS